MTTTDKYGRVVATTFMINPWLVPAGPFFNSQGFE